MLCSDPETTTQLELRALEKMAHAICRHAQTLCDEARGRGVLGSREGEFQIEAFVERRQEAVQLLAQPAPEPASIRIPRLERLIEALECSRAYFRQFLEGSRAAR